MAKVHSDKEVLPKASTPWVWSLWCMNITDRQADGLR